MAQVKSKGNKSTEQLLVSVLRANKITGWRRTYPLFGNPDFVFPKYRVAVFVDGLFWHGHPTKCRLPRTNKQYWIKKIQRNKIRDRYVSKILREKAWNVLRIWEDAVLKTRTLHRIREALK
jgi:DNA mismatch endonuclease (patch repair protein)